MNKNFFLVPNAVYQIDLSAGAKQVYFYLLCYEDRKTFQCYPSYKTIGKNAGMSVNTVRKYVTELVEKQLVKTENTHRFNSEGLKQNSVLRYTILPIQNAVDFYHKRQMAELQRKADMQTAKANAEKLGILFVPTTERTT